MSNIGEIVSAPVIASPFSIGTPDNPWTMVSARFDASLGKAEEMLVRLVGDDGESGYLGDMNSVIQDAPQVSITAPLIDTSITLGTTGLSLPTFDPDNIQDFPTDTYEAPTLAAVPTIDTSDLDGVDLPTMVDPSFTWAADTVPTTVYDAIIARMLADLQGGATGLDPVVEQAIHDRARNRQQVNRDAAYQKLNNDIAGRGFTLPPGALLSALTDFATEGVRMDAEINNGIITTQGDLAQKNSQFMFTQAVALEQLIRQTASETDKTRLEYLRSKATLLVQEYAERVRAYVAIWEGKKAKVQAQAESLRGVIESNRGLIDIFKAQWDALKTRVDAVAASNKGFTDVYLGEVQGYSEAERAMAMRNSSAVDAIKAKVDAAELEVKAAIAEAEQTVQGYTSEMSLRERVTSDMAHVAAQTIASMMSAVNASASLGYSGSSSESKNVSNSASITESHSYEHDPLT
jgi:hypothetical protein